MKDWRIWLILASILIAGVVGYLSSTSLQGAPSYEGTELNGAAPDFKLMDQHGDLVSLSDFDGQIVVLTFMDSQCKDVCHLTAAQLRQAHQHLNHDEANQVVFIAVNVSVEANMAEDVLLATQKWHLDEIPHWHFLTGSAEELTPIWNAYNVAVISEEGDEIIHTPGIFLIDKNRQKRWYISTPYTAEGSVETSPLNELLVKHIREIFREK